MPGALLPDDPSTAAPADWYTPGPELDSFRLSSKSHWDVPIVVGKKTVHFLVSHPTPPVFDDPPSSRPASTSTARRNHDEIRFWADYVGPGRNAGSYIYDDSGNYGGLEAGCDVRDRRRPELRPARRRQHPGFGPTVARPPDGSTRRSRPSSPGGTEQSALQGGANATHLSDPAFDTADFSDGSPGNLRADYVLPSKNLRITDAGVFWPASDDPLFALAGTFPFPSSDHRLVWIDVTHGALG